MLRNGSSNQLYIMPHAMCVCVCVWSVHFHKPTGDKVSTFLRIYRPTPVWLELPLSLSLSLRGVIFSLSHAPIIGYIMGAEPLLSPLEQKGAWSTICLRLFLAQEVSPTLDCCPRGTFNLTREYLFPQISRCLNSTSSTICSGFNAQLPSNPDVCTEPDPRTSEDRNPIVLFSLIQSAD